ncbi:MAG: hypothetical protein ACRC8A_09995 [Microcoleaceae cyanobacterium]
MQSEQVSRAFLEILVSQPEYFAGDAKQDLPRLNTALEQAELEQEEQQMDMVAYAILDFCDVNPDVNQALQAKIQNAGGSPVPSSDLLDSLLKAIQAVLTTDNNLTPSTSNP